MTRKLLLLSFLLILLDGILMTNYHPAMSQPESVEPTIQIQLTSEEKAWLDTRPTIKVRVSNAPPFHFMDQGKPAGFSVDLMDRIVDLIGFDVQYISGIPWPEGLEHIKHQDGKVDLLLTVMNTPERREFMLFSRNYSEQPFIIYTREDDNTIHNIDDLIGKTVAIEEGYALLKMIRSAYPGIRLMEVKGDAQEALRAVSSADADAYIGNMTITNYHIGNLGLTHLKSVATAPFGFHSHCFGVRKDWPELASILNKALNAITPDERLSMLRKWGGSGAAGASSASIRSQLSDEEKAWLTEHKSIRLGVDPAWPPFEFFDATKVYSGIASDYVRRLNENLKINMAPVPNLSWPEVMNKAKAGEIDVLPCVAKTPERSKFLIFSEPYISFPMVILTREDAPFVNGVQDFKNGKVAVVKGYVSQELLQRDYPGREFYLAKDIDEALRAVSKGKIDAFVGNLASISYTTQKLGLTNLKVATTTPYKYDLAFAIRKDWPELVNILNKSIHSIPHLEKTEIHNRWINVRFERKINWILIFQIVGVIVLVGGTFLILILRWNRALSREVAERKRTEAALIESRATARALLDATLESLLLLDNKGIVLAVNKTAANRLQMTPEQLKGTNRFDLLPSEVKKARKARFDKVLRNGTPTDFDDTRDGRIFHSSYFPIQANTGEITGVAIFAVDITDRKRAEEELHENIAELERFSKLAVGREDRMIELKKEINEMLRGLGQPEKYKIVV